MAWNIKYSIHANNSQADKNNIRSVDLPNTQSAQQNSSQKHTFIRPEPNPRPQKNRGIERGRRGRKKNPRVSPASLEEAEVQEDKGGRRAKRSRRLGWKKVARKKSAHSEIGPQPVENPRRWKIKRQPEDRQERSRRWWPIRSLENG